MSQLSGNGNYLANQTVSEEQIQAWVDQFHRDGFLFLQNVLPPDWCAQLREDLDWALKENPNGLNNVSDRTALAHRMFETSETNLKLFDLEPIVSFAEALVAPNCHVIHNNSFQSPPGGGITIWHQDDTPHITLTDGKPPENIRLSVLFFTANYYLTDVTEIKYGGTEVIPGSHLFGASPSPDLENTEWKDKIRYITWGKPEVSLCSTIRCGIHGGKNRSRRTRYITQVTYGRRMIGHKYYSRS